MHFLKDNAVNVTDTGLHFVTVVAETDTQLVLMAKHEICGWQLTV